MIQQNNNNNIINNNNNNEDNKDNKDKLKIAPPPPYKLLILKDNDFIDIFSSLSKDNVIQILKSIKNIYNLTVDNYIYKIPKKKLLHIIKECISFSAIDEFVISFQDDSINSFILFQKVLKLLNNTTLINHPYLINYNNNLFNSDINNNNNNNNQDEEDNSNSENESSKKDNSNSNKIDLEELQKKIEFSNQKISFFNHLSSLIKSKGLNQFFENSDINIIKDLLKCLSMTNKLNKLNNNTDSNNNNNDNSLKNKIIKEIKEELLLRGTESFLNNLTSSMIKVIADGFKLNKSGKKECIIEEIMSFIFQGDPNKKKKRLSSNNSVNNSVNKTRSSNIVSPLKRKHSELDSDNDSNSISGVSDSDDGYNEVYSYDEDADNEYEYGSNCDSSYSYIEEYQDNQEEEYQEEYEQEEEEYEDGFEDGFEEVKEEEEEQYKEEYNNKEVDQDEPVKEEPKVYIKTRGRNIINKTSSTTENETEQLEKQIDTTPKRQTRSNKLELANSPTLKSNTSTTAASNKLELANSPTIKTRSSASTTPILISTKPTPPTPQPEESKIQITSNRPVRSTRGVNRFAPKNNNSEIEDVDENYIFKNEDNKNEEFGLDDEEKEDFEDQDENNDYQLETQQDRLSYIVKGLTVMELCGHFSCNDLRQFCKDKNLKASGNKREISKRIFGYLNRDINNQVVEEQQNNKKKRRN